MVVVASAGGGYSVRNETAHLKKSIEEQSKVVEKVKADNFKIQGRVQHIFDYIAALEDKIEDNDRHYKFHIRSMKHPSPLKESQYHGRSL